MGYMKTIFTDIQLSLEQNDFVSVIETLNNATDKEEHKKELLFDTIETLASWQREEATPRQDHGDTIERRLQ